MSNKGDWRMNSELELKALLKTNPHLKVRSDTGTKAETQPEATETAKKSYRRKKPNPLPDPHVDVGGGMTLPYPVSLNRMYRTAGKRMVISEEGEQYKDAVAGYLLKYKPRLLTGEVAVVVHLYRPRQRGDIDNALKVTLDCLQGFCYKNDDQIVEVTVKRKDDPLFPRMVVYVMEAK